MFTVFDVGDVDGQKVISEDDLTVLIERGTEGKGADAGLVLEQNALPVDVE